MKRPSATIDTSLFPFWLDTRDPENDQHPWITDDFPFPVERVTLPFGDATLKGFERELIFERKTLSDLVGCCGRERERFEKVITGLLGHRLPFLVIEATWADLEAGAWLGELKPSHVLGSVIGWQCRGIHVVTAGDGQRAGRIVARICYMMLRRAWTHARELFAAASVETPVA